MFLFYWFTLKKKKAGLFEPNLGKIWTNPNVGLKCNLKNVQLKGKVEVGFKCLITFLTQHLGLSIFYPNLGSNNPVKSVVFSANVFVYTL